MLAGGLLLAGCGTSPDPTGPGARWPHPPAMTLVPGSRYQAVVRTSAGSFTIRLFARQDPAAVNSFVFLARHRFYDGDRFFRVLPSLFIQAGDPLNDGRGGPGYRLPPELPPPFPYQPGIVALARQGRANSGSQFFICTGPAADALNHSPVYTELGRVTSGMAVVEAIAHGPLGPNPDYGGELSRPRDPVRILSVTILQSGSRPPGRARQGG
ncbi:Peptidyl-prolyl cis-trans isomerase [Candidatus Hydrogenisulfobacillus filiaventi]|uniref:Peptidyl-prolyl cis-trans isomerase n=1 Tax=Candidatus Hydrogenisulfobacillus filiaventi TaxID=2707344 RepID=A0A6F8ZFU2_9FIRM|nr:peptidylprolyl isomerase [Bacillota bacterium]CAB1128804.1 Peptidyl-prolyl cis-trans isomerase [Candidatus Hydrogenisulfobacillus filiaventi]